MKYHDKKFKKCKYCDKEAKRNITSIGRNKGHYTTCGDNKCLSEQHSDAIVNKLKSFKSKEIKGSCLKCNKEFIKGHFNQKWCEICCPDRPSRIIMSRYGLSHYEYLEIIKISAGICPICRRNKPSVIDHCHKTGRIRGFICQHCNTALNLVENYEALQRALIYIK